MIVLDVGLNGCHAGDGWALEPAASAAVHLQGAIHHELMENEGTGAVVLSDANREQIRITLE
jgi:hypothetical protein